MIKRLISAIVLALTSQMSLAQESGAQPKANTARLMWSAFSCATFAEMSGNKKEKERLFELGYKAGKTFIDGVRTKTISEAEIKDAPVGVLWHMSGPTTDFVTGRIFEAATNDAYNKVEKEDSAGLPITDPSKWANDELKTIRAKNKYQSSNATLFVDIPSSSAYDAIKRNALRRISVDPHHARLLTRGTPPGRISLRPTRCLDSRSKCNTPRGDSPRRAH